MENKEPISTEITYTVGRNSKGKIYFKKDYCTVFIPDEMVNLALISSIEVDLEFAVKEQEVSNGR